MEDREQVAVIGIACRLPRADSATELWDLLERGEDCVGKGEFPPARACDIQHVVDEVPEEEFNDPKAPFFTGSWFPSVDKCDAHFFNLPANVAKYIEPEQRVFLELVYELLEDAGCASKIQGTNTGVYVGHTFNKYLRILPEKTAPSISHGNHSPFIGGRVSYTFDLHGPGMMVCTGCSSSLLAVHLASQAILAEECTMAIAGGVSLDLLPLDCKSDIWNQLQITGKGVKCRPFDSKANGIAKGEGAGAVLLKRLSRAIKDGDHIYGVLKATVANHDGASNGITAPQPEAQAAMLHQAWEKARVDPRDIGYIEAHGTGTVLGDPIEVMALTSAFRQHTEDTHFCAIGSLKGNLGHLADGAAGVMGLIKVLLALHHRKIPASIHCDQPNTHIDWEHSPVFVNTTLSPWRATAKPLLAGVSAFGLLGTNVHCVVEEYHQPIRNNEFSDRPLLQGVSTRKAVFILAALTERSLVGLVTRYLRFFAASRSRTERELYRVCATVNTGRELQRFPHRLLVVATEWDSVTSLLATALSEIQSRAEPATYRAKDKCLLFRETDGYCYLHRNRDNVQSFPAESEFAHAADFIRVSELFFRGSPIDWALFPSLSSFPRVCLLPTYCWDRKRFWPEIIKRHQEPSQQCAIEPHIRKESERHELERILNELLGEEVDWDQAQDVPLNSLGIDSLMTTRLSNTLKERLHFTLQPKAIHQGGSFRSILRGVTSSPLSGCTTLTAQPTLMPVRCSSLPRTSTRGVSASLETEEARTQAFATTNPPRVHPLTHAQRGIWVMHLTDPTQTVFNVGNGLLIRGPLDIPTFKRAVESTLASHDVFGISIGQEEGNLYQEASGNLPTVASLGREEAVATIRNSTQEVPVFLQDALNGKITSVAHFPGQGGKYRAELRGLLERGRRSGCTSHRLAVELFRVLAQDSREIVDLPNYFPRDFDYEKWVQDDSAQEGRLENCPLLSIPLLFVTQILHYAILCELTGANCGALRDQWQCLVGHSSGLAAATVIAASCSFTQLLDNSVAMLKFLFRVGLRSVRAGFGTESCMIAVGAGASTVRAHLNEMHTKDSGCAVAIALTNSASNCVVAGSPADLGVAAAFLKGRGLVVQPLDIRVPYHTAYLQEVYEQLCHDIDALKLEFVLPAATLAKVHPHVDEAAPLKSLAAMLTVTEVDWQEVTDMLVALPQPMQLLDFGSSRGESIITVTMQRLSAELHTVGELSGIGRSNYGHRNTDFDNSLDCASVEHLAQSFLRAQFRIPFSLERGPLIRCHLVNLGDEVNFLSVVLHHIIFDGWSHFLFYNEIWRRYTLLAMPCEEAPLLPTSSFLEYADRYPAGRGDAHCSESMSFWRENLKEAKAIAIPGDKPRPTVFSFCGHKITRVLDVDLVKALKAIRGTTLFQTLMAAMFALMHQLTGEQDIVIGSQVANRTSGKVEHVIGCFVNTVLYRVREFSSGWSSTELVAHVKQVVVDALAHSEVPFGEIVEALHAERYPAFANPLFNVNVVLHNTEMKRDHVDPPTDLCVQRFVPEDKTCKWDFYWDFLEEDATAHGGPSEGGIVLRLEYYAEAYSEGFVNTLLDNFEDILRDLGGVPDSAPARPLSISAPLAWTPCPSLAESLLMVVAGMQDRKRICLLGDEQALTYRALHKRSSRLVAAIANVSVPGARIAILAQDPILVAVIVLGVLLANRSFLLLNPSHPRGRLIRWCRITGCSLLLHGTSDLAVTSDLLWSCSALQATLCCDSKDVGAIIEPSTPLGSAVLWNHVASSGAGDAISGGGWRNSYNNDLLSREEMEAFGANVLNVLSPFLTSHARVLEIGSASGISLRQLAPLVRHYVATDLSRDMLHNLQPLCAECGLDNVDFICCDAIQIGDRVGGAKFDIIVMNSVIQYFPGLNYLRHVLKQCAGLLAPNGVLYVGDILDLDSRQEFIRSVYEYKKRNPRAQSKNSFYEELYLSRESIVDLAATIPGFDSVKCMANKNSASELRFRFDALFFAGTGHSPFFNKCNRRMQYDLSSAKSGATNTHPKAESDASHHAQLLTLVNSPNGLAECCVPLPHLARAVDWELTKYDVTACGQIPWVAGHSTSSLITLLVGVLAGATMVPFPAPTSSQQAEGILCRVAERDSIGYFKGTTTQLWTMLRKVEAALPFIVFVLQVHDGASVNASLLNALSARQKGISQFDVFTEFMTPAWPLPVLWNHVAGQNLPLLPGTVVPLGTALPPHQLGVVDGHGKLVNVSAHGYLRVYLPELDTGENLRFPMQAVFHPRQIISTHQRARLLPNGRFEMIRESSLAVTIDGSYVEPTEVEHTLISLLDAATARLFNMSDGKLVAFVTRSTPDPNPMHAADPRIIFWNKHLSQAQVMELPHQELKMGDAPMKQMNREDVRLKRQVSLVCWEQKPREIQDLIAAALCALVATYSRATAVLLSMQSTLGLNDAAAEGFAIWLPLCISVPWTTSLDQFKRAVSRSYSTNLEHLDLHPGTIVACLPEGRRFQVGLIWNPISSHENGSLFDLDINVEVNPTNRRVSLLTNPRVFSQAMTCRMATHLKKAITSFVRSPEIPLTQLRVLPLSERQLVLTKWSQGPLLPTSAACIHEAFEQQARRTPDAIAIKQHDSLLTYKQLDEQADELARYLTSLGVSSGTFVGILVNRSPYLPIAMLGVLKAGGAYIPIDPDFPEQRIQLYLLDAGATVLVTVTALLAKAGSFKGSVINLDDPLPASPFGAKRHGNVKPQDLCFLLYTSGSTGRPKGVMVHHAGAQNLLAFLAAVFSLQGRTKWLAVTTICFDIAQAEFLASLQSGLCVEIADDGEVKDPALLVKLLVSSGADVMQTTPSRWRLMLNTAEGWSGVSDNLLILCGGEALSSELTERLLAYGTVWNGYGPTETSMYSTCQFVNKGEPVLIGRPVANTQIFVLDDLMQLVPIGVPGELYIGGIGVSNGYYGQPELTKQLFVPNCYGDGTLYRTGDIVRFTDDGRLEYKGRKDQQVKIYGCRVELPELEKALCQAGAETALVALADPSTLVAFVTPKHASLRTLKQTLSRTLPKYMMPHVIVPAETLSYLPNGKADRKAMLQAYHNTQHMIVSNEPVASFISQVLPWSEKPHPILIVGALPTTATQAQQLVTDLVPLNISSAQPLAETATMGVLKRLWNQLLPGAPVPAAEDDFFELGGDSIQVIYLMWELAKHGWAVNVQDLQRCSLLGQQHVLLSRLPRRETPASKTETYQVGNELSAPVLAPPAIQKFYQQGHTNPDRFVFSALLRFSAAIHGDRAHQAVHTIIQRHLSLRSAVVKGCDGRIFLRPMPAGEEVPYYTCVVTEPSQDNIFAEPTVAEFVARLESHLSVSQGKLVVVGEITYGSDNYLLLVVHHFAVDLVSWTLLVDELETLYAAPEIRSSLPAPTSYYDLCLALANAKPTPTERAYWQRLRETSEHCGQLPTIHSNDALFANSAVWEISLSEDADVWQQKDSDSLYCTLLVALARSLSRVHGQNLSMITVEVHGRDSLGVPGGVLQVGDLAVSHPLMLDAEFSVQEMRDHVKRVPKNGIGYTTAEDLVISTVVQYVHLGYLSSKTRHESFTYLPWPTVMLSELQAGRFHRDSNEKRAHGIEFFTWGYGACLQLLCYYDQTMFARETVAQLVSYLRDEFLAAIAGDSSKQCLQESPVERLMAKVAEEWATVLQTTVLPQRQANFFLLGGDSLKAMQVVSRLQCDLNREIELTHLLHNPELAAFVEAISSAPLLPVAPEPHSCDEKSTAGTYVSAAETRLALLQAANSASTAYIETVVWRITNGVTFSEVQEAVRAIVRAHPVLRSCFAINQKHIQRQLLSEESISCIQRHVDKLNTCEMLALLSEMECHILSENAALCKFHWFDIGDNGLLVMSVHHSIIDAASCSIIEQQLNALLAGEKSPVLESDTFPLYLELEQEYLADKDNAYATDLAFWRNAFECPLEPCALPYDFPANTSAVNAVQLNDPAEQLVVSLSRASVSDLRNQCTASGLTLFQYSLGCFLFLLHRYSGGNDLCTLIPVSSRSHRTARSVGMFVNTMPFRFALDSSGTFGEFVQAVGAQFIQWQAHSRFPLEEIIRLAKAGGMESSSFLETMINYEERPAALDRIPVANKYAKVNLGLDIIYWPASRTMAFVFEYKSNMFGKDTIRRLAHNYRTVFCHGLRNMHRGLSQLSFGSEKERFLLHYFSGVPNRVPRGNSAPILQLFERHAQRVPAARCVTFLKNTLTYEEINRLAERVAFFLLSTPEFSAAKPVVVMATKSETLIPLLLGVWKAGGYFIPVSAQAAERLPHILASSQATLLITNTTNCDHASTGHGVRVLRLEDLLLHDMPKREASAISRLAYVIYTSGSTGTPKPCKITHANLRAIVTAWTKGYHLATFPVVLLQWVAFSFDVFIGDLMKALFCVQGHLVICPDEKRQDLRYLGKLLARWKATFLEVTPHIANLLLDECPEAPATLHTLVIGSDSLLCKTFDSIRTRLPRTRVVNSYGMSEATIGSCFFENAGYAPTITVSGVTPLGKPLTGVTMHVLDKYHQPVPIGAVGELCLGGETVGLMNGETATFIDIQGTSHRLLRTHDQARWLPSGDIEFLGRNDRTQKVRGIRVDEVELEQNILASCPGMFRNVYVVVANGDSAVLVALILPAKGIPERQPGEWLELIRSKLQGRIPYDVIPKLVCVLAEIPLSHHGKVSRKQLQLQAINCIRSRTSAHHPTTSDTTKLASLSPVEIDLSNAWQELTGTPIERDRGFLEQGDSLNLMRFHQFLKRRYRSWDLKIGDLFRLPTIKDLATHLLGCTPAVPLPGPTIKCQPMPQGDRKSVV